MTDPAAEPERIMRDVTAEASMPTMRCCPAILHVKTLRRRLRA
ncbi:hypothetical protein [Mesorhizobium sp. M0768]